MRQVFLTGPGITLFTVIVFYRISGVLANGIITVYNRYAGLAPVVPYMVERRTVAQGIYGAIGKGLRVQERLAGKLCTVNATGHIAVIIHPGNGIDQYCSLAEVIVNTRCEDAFVEIAEFNIAVFLLG